MVFVKNVQGKRLERGVNCFTAFLHSLREGAVYGWYHPVIYVLYIMGFFSDFMTQVVQSIILWASKYVYHGDTHAIARHIRILGITNFFTFAVALSVGIIHDKFSEKVMLPVSLVIACGFFFGVYYINPFNSVLAYALQIAVEIFSGTAHLTI